MAYLCGFDFSTVAPKPRAEGSSPSAPAKGNGLSKDRFCFYIKRIKLIAEGLEGDR